MLNYKLLKTPLLLLVVGLALINTNFAQTTTATLSGSVTDDLDAAVAGATVKVTNTDAGFERMVTTNSNGTFTVPLLPPAMYRITIERSGFAPFEVPEIVLNANAQRALNIRLKIGAVGETVDVDSQGSLIDENPTVGTSIDREFIQNLPLNGRSLQTLIALSPGVVAVPVASNGSSQGQFSVNGQRANANYFTVDGVSGNFSVTNFESLGQNGSGSIPTTNISGGFSNLASVDALQEFTIQTSTFAAEFGRSPGGQVSLVTRSGENAYHGSLFEYVRNDKFDARDFFDARKPPLRYNNFGGTFGGPVVLPHFGEGTPFLWKGRDKTFFFFSYEGQRFVLPQPAVSVLVPSLAARQNAPNEISKAILNAYPLPNGADIRNSAGNLTGGATYTATYSNPNNSDSLGIRLDHNFNKNFTIFGRFSYSPSNANIRSTANPSTYQTLTQNTRTLTIGGSQVFSSKLVNEIRANYSGQEGFANYVFDGNGGGVEPLLSLFLPASTSTLQRRFTLNPITDVTTGSFTLGDIVKNESRQLQVVDNLSYSLGAHQLKFGGDYRWLSPITAANDLIVSNSGNTLTSIYDNVLPTFIAFRSLQYVSEFKTASFYGQDTWKVNKRMTLSYGLRWEINPAPAGRGGKTPLTYATPPDLTKLDQSSLTLAPFRTKYYETDYMNFAPRVGLSYLLSRQPGRELVVRGGAGVFYDLGQTGFGSVGFPYSLTVFTTNIPLPVPISAITFAPVNFTPSPTNRGSLTVADPDYTLPRTYQWNLTAEQSLGKNQALSVAYVAALGRKLIRARTINFVASSAISPISYFSPNFSGANYIDNGTESSYHSLQSQFTRRLSRGLQVIASYTWSHSIDNGSTDGGITSPGYVFDQSAYRGNSDFDVRHNFSGALTYNLSVPKLNGFSDAVLRGWSLNSVFSARSGLPFNVLLNEVTVINSSSSFRRPNLTGAPLYVDDPSVATGRRLNPAAFNFIVPAGQMGNLGRNILRGPAFWQIDMGLHRTFGITEKVKLELRAEAFNVLNHASFTYPANTVGVVRNGVATTNSTFGVITQSAGRAYGGGVNTGGFNPLFQNGGPRSMQFAARLSF